MRDTVQVLIIDKNSGRLCALGEKLDKRGLKVTCIRHKDFSTETLKTVPDVILLDESLAGLVKKIRSPLALMPTPILLLHPGLPKGGIDKDMLKGADDFLVGPFSENEVITRIQSLRQKRKRCVTETALDGLYEALNRIIKATRSGSDDLAVLKIASRETELMIPGVRCTIIMLGEKKGKASALDFEGEASIQNIPLDLKKYPEIRRVIETRQPLAIRDVTRHPLLREVRELIRGKPLFSFLLIPIFFQEEMIGLFFLRSLEFKRSFLAIEISFMKMMAVTTASALRNVRLDRSIQTELIRARTAREDAKAKGKISRRLEKLFEHTADGLLLVNRKGEITDINTNFSRLSGFSKGKAVGMNADEILVPVEKNQKPLGSILKGKTRAALINYQLVRREGESCFVAVHLEPLPGQKKEYILSLHDLTEKHQTDLVLQRTKDFLESVIQHSMDAIIAADMKGIILVFNQAAEKITGYKAEDIIGKRNIIQMYFPGGAKDIMNKLRNQHYGGVGKLEACASTLINSDGEEIPINVSAAVIYNEEGEEVATVGVLQDLRERIDIEKQLRKAQERLLESQRKEAVSALAGAAAHELNQPLTSILGYAELLQRAEKNLSGGRMDETAVTVFKNAADVIAREAERMAEVVRKLGEITEYDTKEYLGDVRIMDLDRKGIKGNAASKLEFWNSLFKSASFGLVTIGEDTIITRANPAAELITGKSPVGKSIADYLKGAQYSDAMKEFYKLVRDGKAEGEIRIKGPDGHDKTIFARAARIEENKEYIAVIQDMTVTRSAETAPPAKLEMQQPEPPADGETRLWALQEMVKILRSDTDWESALKETLVLLKGAIDFQAAGVFFPEAENELVFLDLDRDATSLRRGTIRLREDLWRFSQSFFKEGPLVYDDIQLLDMSVGSEEFNLAVAEIGERDLRSVIIIPLLLQGNTMGGLYLASKSEGFYKTDDIPFLENVSSHIGAILASSRLSDIKSRLLHSEKLALVGQMAAGIAHDMNNPLAAISASAEMILAHDIQKEDNRGVERAERILECTQHIQNMIVNLMEFARPSTSERIEIDVRNMIDKALAFSSSELKADNLTVENRVPRELPPVMGVADQLQQVFINLISNAAQACESKDQARIAITAQMTDNEYIEISVKDNGAGIDPRYQKMIFDPFFTSRADKGGTGLGLSIVKDILNRHEGTIHVESAPDKGSIFRVTLPLGKEGLS